MKSVVFLFLFSFISIFSLYPQTDYNEAFLVTSERDTLKGYIRTTSEIIHIEQGLYFKADKGAKEKLYKMKEIVAYGTESGKLFYKKKIPRGTLDSVVRFVEVLFIGTINLYQYKYEYFLEKDARIFKLKNTENEIRNEEGNLVKKQKKEYIATLSVLVSDCFKLYDRVIKTDLNYQDLVRLLQEYHECINGDYTLVTDDRNFEPILNFGLFFGGFTTSKSATIITDRRNEVTGLTAQNLIFGGELQFRFNNYYNFYLVSSPQFSFRNEYYYGSSRVEGGNFFNFDLNYQFNQIDFPLGIGWDLNSKKIQPVFSSGFVVSHLWAGKYNYAAKRRPLNGGVDDQTTTGEFEGDFPANHMFGVWTSFGIKYHLAKSITFFNRIRYQTNNFYTESGRVQNNGSTFNYHQLKLEIGVLF
jgi:hypothetical protein